MGRFILPRLTEGLPRAGCGTEKGVGPGGGTPFANTQKSTVCPGRPPRLPQSRGGDGAGGPGGVAGRREATLGPPGFVP